MGKAVIVSGGGGGFYSIRRVYDTAVRDKLIEEIQKDIDEAEADITRLESDLAALETEVDALKATNATLIDEYVAETQTEEPDLLPFQERIKDAQLAAFNLTQKVTPVQAALDEARARKFSAEKKLAAIEGANPDTEVAWCADLTEDLSPGTEVATIELPGEPQSIVIAPSGRPHQASDGILMPTEWMTPAQAFFNTAILPGVQRWRPFFRTGRIRSIDYDANTCSLELEDERSNWQSLPVNDRRRHDNVPIEYMTCDAFPFGIGDRVVTEMQTDVTAVRVLGFPDFPRPCDEPGPRAELASDYVYLIHLEPRRAGNDVPGDIFDDGIDKCDGGPVLSGRFGSTDYIRGLDWKIGVTQTFAGSEGEWISRELRDSTSQAYSIRAASAAGPAIDFYSGPTAIGPSVGVVDFGKPSGVGDTVLDDRSPPAVRGHSVVPAAAAIPIESLPFNIPSLASGGSFFKDLRHQRELNRFQIRCSPPGAIIRRALIDHDDPVEENILFEGPDRNIEQMESVSQEGFTYTPIAFWINESSIGPGKSALHLLMVTEGENALKETAPFELRFREEASAFRELSDECSASDSNISSCPISEYDYRFARKFTIRAELIFVPSNKIVRSWDHQEVSGNDLDLLGFSRVRAYDGEPVSNIQYETKMGAFVTYAGATAPGSFYFKTARNIIGDDGWVCCPGNVRRGKVSNDKFAINEVTIDRLTLPLATADQKAWQIIQFGEAHVDSGGTLVVPCVGRRV